MQKERHTKIIEIMEKKHVISIKELAGQLNCTEMTVRRNLDELQNLNFVRREHGYATLLKTAQPTDYPLQAKENASEKEAIATAALRYIHPNTSICLDCGTTIHQMVKLLPVDIPLSIITTNLIATMTLTEYPNTQVLIPLGFLHHPNRSILLAEPDSMKTFTADTAFISCRAFRAPVGAFENTHSVIATKKALAGIARQKILLMDYSKWDLNSLCTSIPLEELDIIITDNKAPEKSVQMVADLGKEIIVVNPDTRGIEAHYNKTG